MITGIETTDVGVMTMINAADYGIIGDNSTLNDTGLSAAIAAANAAGVGGRGVDLYLPAGIYRHANALPALANNVTLVGAGWQSTVLMNTSATASSVLLGSGAGNAGCGIRNLSIWHTGIPTAGAAIDVNFMSDCLIENVIINNCYQGVYVHGGSIKVWIDRVEINNTGATANAAGILVTNGLAGDTYIRQVIMSNGSASTAGIQITQSGHFEIIGCNITKSTYGLLINPGAAATYVSYGFIEHSLFDSCVTAGMYINANTNADAQVRSLYFNDCWFSGSTGTGYGVQLNITTNGVVNDINFNFCRFLNNQQQGLLLSSASVTNVTLIRCTLAGNGAVSSNTVDAVTIPANTNGVTISYCKIGGNVGTAGNTQRYAISVAAGTSSDLKFTNNDCQPNGTVGTQGYINIGTLTGGGNVIRDNSPCIFAGTGSCTIAASAAINTSETVISAPYRMFANGAYAGTIWKFKATGTCTTTGANVSTFRVRLGTAGTTGDTVIMTFATPVAGTTGTTDAFSVEITICCRTVGGAATFYGVMEIHSHDALGIIAAKDDIILGTAAAGVTTNQNYIELTYQSAAATTTCTFQQVKLTIDSPGNAN